MTYFASLKFTSQTFFPSIFSTKQTRWKNSAMGTVCFYTITFWIMALWACGTGRRWKSNKFTLHGHLGRNNIKLFPDSPLKSIKMQSNSQGTISNEGSAACRTKYEGRTALGAVCYIPASIQPYICDKNDPFITPTNAVNVLYRLVVFCIRNRLPAKHDNKSCVKGNCGHTQLWTNTKLHSLFDVQ